MTTTVKAPKTRLNSVIRSAIVNKCIADTVGKRVVALLKEEGELAREARKLSFGGQIDQIEKAIQSLHAAEKKLEKETQKSVYVNTSNIMGRGLNVNIRGMTHHLSFVSEPVIATHSMKSSRLEYFSESDYLATDGSSYGSQVIVRDEDLQNRILANRDALEDLESEAVTILSTIKALLRSCQTLEKLLEMWPEAKDYIPDDLSPKTVETAGLPISISDLNNKLTNLAA